MLLGTVERTAGGQMRIRPVGRPGRAGRRTVSATAPDGAVTASVVIGPAALVQVEIRVRRSRAEVVEIQILQNSGYFGIDGGWFSAAHSLTE